MSARRSTRHARPAKLSILSRPEGRLRYAVDERDLGRAPLSILSRPEGRLRCEYGTAYLGEQHFQSSAAPKDGCDPAS